MTRNERLIQARLVFGLTQGQAAKLMRISPQVLSAIENGRIQASRKGRPGPRWVVSQRGWTPSARRISRFYGLEPSELWPAEAARYCAEILRQAEREED